MKTIILLVLVALALVAVMTAMILDREERQGKAAVACLKRGGTPVQGYGGVIVCPKLEYPKP
jgi:hypothetical protein